MRIAFLLLLSALASSTLALRDCTKDDLSYGFSPCDVNSERVAYPYLADDATCNTTSYAGKFPQPLRGLSCDVSCGPGYHLDVNVDTSKSECAKCEANTYSVGGGIRYDAWQPLPRSFHTECFSYSYTSGAWEDGVDCTAWSAKSGTNGTVVWSGDQEGNNYLFSILTSSHYFQRDGHVRFRYRVDAEPGYDGLYFSIDNARDEKFGFVSQQPTFTEYTVNVSAGEHTLQWEYYKDTIISSGLDGVEIMAVEVKGLAPSDLECTPCPTGTHSSKGASRCTACAANQFSDNSLSGTCINCPNGTWSLPGSIGNSSCTPRQPCTAAQYSVNYTDCTPELTRQMYYNWIQPHTCDEASGVALPNDGEPTEVPCEACNPGTARTSESGGACVACEEGMYSTDGSEDSCQTCPAGSSAPGAHYFTYFTVWPTGMSTTCSAPTESGQCPESYGWRLRDDRIESGEAGLDVMDVVLRYEVDLESNGLVRFEYNISHATTGAALVFKDNGRELGNARTSSNTVQEIYQLEAGHHVLAWHYTRNVDANRHIRLHDHANIYKIVIEGVAQGRGAYRCTPCLPGTYAATEGSSICTACPMGRASTDASVDECPVCPANTFSDKVGSTDCTPCGDNTYSDEESDRCSTTGIVSANRNGTDMTFDMSALKHAEDESLFGPIIVPDPEKGERRFFLGGLDRGHARMPNGTLFTNDPPSLAAEVSPVANDELPSVTTCSQGTKFGVTSLGRHLSLTPETSGNYTVTAHYTKGSICGEASGFADAPQFETYVHFSCEKDEGIGMAQFLPELSDDDCVLHFRWPTSYACPECTADDYTAVRGPCVSGWTDIEYILSGNCVGGLPLPSPTRENCTAMAELDDLAEAQREIDDEKRYATMLTIGLIGAVVVCGALVVLYMRIRSRAQKSEEELDAMKAQFGDSLLQDVPSSGGPPALHERAEDFESSPLRGGDGEEGEENRV